MNLIRVLAFLLVLTACAEATSRDESQRAYFMKWETLTRYKYDVEDLIRTSDTHRSVPDSLYSDIQTYIANSISSADCELESLNVRFAISESDEFTLAADYFCVCDALQRRCVDNDERFRNTVSETYGG